MEHEKNEDMEEMVQNENISEEEKQIIDRYNLNDFDEEDDVPLNHSELVVFASNQQDPYLNNDAFSDVSICCNFVYLIIFFVVF